MEIRETRGELVEAVKIWRFKDFVSQARKVAHALIVRHDQNDVGPFCLKRFGSAARHECVQHYNHRKGVGDAK